VLSEVIGLNCALVKAVAALALRGGPMRGA